MTAIFRPMLAATVEDIHTVVFPKLLSPKIDGMRCLIRDGRAFSRYLKPIANEYIFEMLLGLPSFDGELIVGSASDPDLWNSTVSGVRTRSGTPNFVLAVFDLNDKSFGFADRIKAAEDAIADVIAERPEMADRLMLVPHVPIETTAEMMTLEEQWVERGYEGIMLRDPAGPYKLGRSTESEQYLMKLKRFFDAEAEIVGFTEALANKNEAMISELGLTKRSTHKENKVPKGMLGAFEVRLPGKEDTFEIGSGFTQAQRIDFWNRRVELLGRHVTFKYRSVSPTGVARNTVFLRFADDKAI